MKSELKDAFSFFYLLHAFFFTGPPARPLGPITVHAAGAAQCPNVSNDVVKSTCVGVCSPRLREASDWLLTQHAHGGVRQV